MLTQAWASEISGALDSLTDERDADSFQPRLELHVFFLFPLKDALHSSHSPCTLPHFTCLSARFFFQTRRECLIYQSEADCNPDSVALLASRYISCRARSCFSEEDYAVRMDSDLGLHTICYGNHIYYIQYVTINPFLCQDDRPRNSEIFLKTLKNKSKTQQPTVSEI